MDCAGHVSGFNNAEIGTGARCAAGGTGFPARRLAQTFPYLTTQVSIFPDN